MGGGHELVLLSVRSKRLSDECALTGARGLVNPLSAQAHAPNRPSGADKKEVQNEGESRPGRLPAPGAIARKSRRIDILPSLVCFPRSPGMVNGALPRGR